MRKLILILVALGLGIAAAVALAAGTPTTGTNTSCATATTPAHTVGVDGTDVHTIPGDTATQCHVETYTVPTVTDTVTATTPTDTTPTTTTPTPPPGQPTNCAALSTGNQPSAATLDACGYPSPNTTGPTGTLTPVAQATLPAGASWNATAGELRISGSNVTVSGVDVQGGQVIFTGSNSKLVNSRVTCGGGADCVLIQGTNGNTLSHDDVEGTSSTSSSGFCGRAVHMSGGATVFVDHLLVRNCADGVVGISHTSDSYIFINVVYCGPACSHDEPIYLPGGNGSITQDIEHNTLLIPVNQVSAVFGDDHAYGPLKSSTINNNLVMSNGSNGFIATGKPGDGNTGIVVTNNRFSYVYNSGEPTGQSTPGTTWSGNYRDDTLQAVAISTG